MGRVVTRFYLNGKPIAKKFIKNKYVLEQADFLRGVVNPIADKGCVNFKTTDGGNLKVVVSCQRNKR